MKEYKYTINGTKYEVAVGDIEENIVTVTVNGETYKVEMEKEAEPEKKKPVLGKPAAAAAENASVNSSTLTTLLSPISLENVSEIRMRPSPSGDTSRNFSGKRRIASSNNSSGDSL